MPSPQAPIASDFNRSSTAAEVIRGHDRHGRTVIVTGGSAGIGLETTRVLASAGAQVLVPARDVEKARSAVGALATVEPMELTEPPRPALTRNVRVDGCHTGGGAGGRATSPHGGR